MTSGSTQLGAPNDDAITGKVYRTKGLGFACILIDVTSFLWNSAGKQPVPPE